MFKEIELKKGYSTTSYLDKIKLITLDELNNFLSNFSLNNGFAICYIYGKIIFGRIENNKLFFNEDDININETNLIRIFNENIELLLLRNENYFSGKVIDDTKGDITEYIDTVNVIFGTKINSIDNENKFTLITEERGIDVELPFLVKNINPQKRLKIMVRNYIKFNQYNHAYFGDYRFIKFKEDNNE
jgi:CRISPR-associated protein (TIGR03984 family)